MAGQVTTKGIAVAQSAVPQISSTVDSVHSAMRQAQRVISNQEIQKILNAPKITLQQSADKFLYLTSRGGVVVDRITGTIVTTYSKREFYQNTYNIIINAYKNDTIRSIIRSTSEIIKKVK